MLGRIPIYKCPRRVYPLIALASSCPGRDKRRASALPSATVTVLRAARAGRAPSELASMSFVMFSMVVRMSSLQFCGG